MVSKDHIAFAGAIRFAFATLSAACLAWPGIVYGQSGNQAIQQNLLQREQSLENFQLRGEQQKQLLLPGLTAGQKDRLSRQYLIEQQKQQLLHSQQMRDQSVPRPGGGALPLPQEVQGIELQQLQQRDRHDQLDNFARERDEAERRSRAEEKQ